MYSILIRLVLDLIDYSYLIWQQILILFGLFFKAFDTIESNFLCCPLGMFGLRVWLKTLYSNSNCSIKLQHESSSRSKLKDEIWQGSPLSLFSCSCTSVGAYYILSAGHHHCTIISQLADDTLFLTDNLNTSSY